MMFEYRRCLTTTWQLALLFLAGAYCQNITTPPNIIFILSDDYGFNDIGYHGSEINTPWLDKLALGGVRLENYYVQPICSPTRSQLLSGRYQIHTGLEHSIIWDVQPNCLPLTDMTIADKLRTLGYATHAVGKWHLGFYKKACWPTRRGFDTFFGYYTGGEDYYTHARGCGMPGYDCSNFTIGYDLRDQETPVKQYAGQYSTHLFAERAKQILDEHDPTKPFFMYLPFQAVHSPLQVPAEYEKPYASVTNYNRRVYSGMVSCMDEAIGNITEHLGQLGLLANTVIVFSTDNGGEIVAGGNNWPLRGWKRSLWEGGMRGVGFVHSELLPQSVRGTVNKELIHVSDWLPTLVAGVAGGSVKDMPLDGYNVWKTISQNQASPRTEILHNIDPLEPLPTEHHSDHDYKYTANWSGTYNTSTRAAIRSGDWKLITGYPGNGSWIPVPNSGISPIHPNETKGKHLWLFNVKDDPYEMKDLSASRSDIVADLVRRLEGYASTMVPTFYPPGDPRSNPSLLGGIWTNWE